MSHMRMVCVHVVQSSHFESIMGILVLLNCLSLGIEGELEIPNSCDDSEVRLAEQHCQTQAAFFYLDYIFLLIFTLELAMRLYAFGLFAAMSIGGMFDAAIVVLGWISTSV